MLIMLFSLDRPQQQPRLLVLAYDISSPRRARRARRLLHWLHHAKQYSVFEMMLTPAEMRGVLAELSDCCDLAKDKLAVWWPRNATRVEWQGQKLRPITRAAEPGPGSDAAPAIAGCGNFIVCYDVSDPQTLEWVGGRIARQGAMVQRSVYWLRLPPHRLAAVLERCGQHLAERDRLWAYPLRSADELWRIGEQRCSILPVAADRWARSHA
jgi:CRISPR-associated endonuclease Cas2